MRAEVTKPNNHRPPPVELADYSLGTWEVPLGKKVK